MPALNRSLKWLSLCTIFVLCFALRVGVGAAVDAAVPVIKRADVYSDIAANLTRGHGFVAEPGGAPIMWRAPLYPAFLAVLYALFGEHNETAVFVAQSALDAITAMLIFYLGARLFSESVGLVSALIFALHPLSAYYSLRFLSEPLFTLAFTAAIAAWIVAVRVRRVMAYLAVGALIALAALVKPVALGLWPLLMACACYQLRREPRRALSAAIAWTIACLMVLAPWAARNYRLTGELVAVATGGGYALWLGNQMVSEGLEDWEVDESTRAHLIERRDVVLAPEGSSDRPLVSVSDRATIRSATEPVYITVQEDHAFSLAAWREIASHPFDSALLTVRKVFRFWFRIFLPDNRWAQPSIVLFQTVFLALAVMGMLEARRQGGILLPLMVPIIFLTAAHALTFATIRYSIPALPVMTLLMTVGLRVVVHRLNERWGVSLGLSWLRWLRAAPSGVSASLYRETPFMMRPARMKDSDGSKSCV